MKVEYISIGNTPCKLYTPDSGSISLAVLAAHGFGGDKESSAVAALADTLCPHDAAVYCFDFPAHGTHPSDDLTVAACHDALLSAAEYMLAQHASARKAVFATSFGGYMALRCLSDLDNMLGAFALVLRAPAVKMAETFGQRIAGANLAKLEAGDAIECGFGRTFFVRKEFLEELQKCGVCRPCGRSMLVIHGTSDDVVTRSDIAAFMELNPQALLVQIPGAGHRFKGPGELDAAIEAASRFILETCTLAHLAPLEPGMPPNPSLRTHLS